jgi:hypothetical protein
VVKTLSRSGKLLLIDTNSSARLRLTVLIGCMATFFGSVIKPPTAFPVQKWLTDITTTLTKT